MNLITIAFCEEDRNRLDKILEALSAKGACGTTEKESMEAVEEVSPPLPDDAAPPVTLADIQKKVVSLSAAGKKSQVRDIVKAYAERVSQIPQDKLSEVYAKLADIETN